MSTTVEVNLNNLMEERGETIKKVVETALLDNIKNTLSWTAEAQIREAVTKFMQDTVTPEIGAYLDANKATIVAQIHESLSAAFKTTADEMAKIAAKNLANSYTLEQVMKAMFG